jgi:hypothetical protein
MNKTEVTGQEESSLNLGLGVVECGCDADSTANCKLVQCKVHKENKEHWQYSEMVVDKTN